MAPEYHLITSGDFDHVSGTVDDATQRYILYENASGLSDYPSFLTGVIPTLKSLSNNIQPPTSGEYGSTFTIQLWDGFTLNNRNGNRYPLNTEQSKQDVVDRFNHISILIQNNRDFKINTDLGGGTAFRDFVSGYQIPMMVHVSNDVPRANRDILIANTPEAYTVGVRDNYDSTSNLLNNLNGDVTEITAKRTLMNIASLMSGIPTLTNVTIDTEINMAVTSGEISDKVAELQGIDNLILWPTGTDVRELTIVPDDDPEFQSLSWHYSHRTKNTSMRAISTVAKEVWPNFEIGGDTLYRLYDLNDIDFYQAWTPIRGGLNSYILTVPERVQRLQTYNRIMDVKDTHLVVGPQMGRTLTLQSVEYRRAYPQDMYSEAVWLAIAFGARGTTGWGFQTLFQTNTPEITEPTFADNGEDMWATLKTIKDTFVPLSSLLLNWAPTTKRTAILESDVDFMYESGRGTRVTGANPKSVNRGWISRFAFRNTYFAMLTTGEPVDIVIDRDDFTNYNVLIIPRLYMANQSLIDKIQNFVDGGGTVIVHAGSVLDGEVNDIKTLTGIYSVDPEDPTSLAPDNSRTRAAAITAPEYDDFIHNLGLDILSKLPYPPMFDLQGNRAIVNKMTKDGTDYLIVVNNDRISGPESEWYSSIEPDKPDRYTDLGQALTISNTLPYNLTDIITDEVISPGANIDLDAGWGRIFTIESVPTLVYTLSIPELSTAGMITSDMKTMYTNAIDALLEDTACMVPCRLIFGNTKWNDCPNCIFNPISGRSSNKYQSGGPAPFYVGTCPICHGIGKIPDEQTETINLMPLWDYKDWVKLSSNVRAVEGRVQTLSKMDSVMKLKRAKEIILDTDIEQHVKHRFIRIGEPQPVGFGQNSYIFTMWDRIE